MLRNSKSQARMKSVVARNYEPETRWAEQKKISSVHTEETLGDSVSHVKSQKTFLSQT
jgi:hypothetical protein